MRTKTQRQKDKKTKRQKSDNQTKLGPFLAPTSWRGDNDQNNNQDYDPDEIHDEK